MKKMTKAMLMTALILGSVQWGGTAVHAEELNSFTMDEYIVTATRYAKADLDIAADTQVIDRQQIEAIGATNVQTLLQTVPGVVYQAKGPGGATIGAMTSKISIRGVETGTLVLVNGSPINYRGLYNLENISTDNIERIEIVKGGGSVLYGSEATGGVINIITKEKMNNSIHIGLGNHERQNHGLNVQAGKLGVSYNYDKWGDTGKTSDSYTVLSNPTSDKNMSNHFNGSERNNVMLNYKFSDYVDFIYTYGKSNTYYTYMFDDPKYTANGKARYDRKYDKEENFFQLNFKDDSGWKGNLYFNQNEIDTKGTDYLSRTGSATGYPQAKDTYEKNLTYGYDVQKLWQENKNNYLLGTTLQREEFQESSSGTWDKKRTRNIYSVYGSWETGVGTKDQFTLSARETWTTGADESKNYDNFSAQAQYLRKLDDKQSVYASVGQSFEMPSFSNMYAAGEDRIIGNPNLKPLKGIHYEIGYKHETETHRHKVALFSTEIEDDISFSKDTVDDSKYRAQNEDFKNVGIELSTEILSKNGFTYNYGLTYSDPKCKTNTEIEGVITDWRRTFGRLQLTGGMTYTKDKWTANVTANYLAERVITTNTKGVEKVKPYLLTTFNLRYAADENNEFTLSMDNILDRRDNVNHSSSYYYSTPYTFLLSYNYKF